MTKIAETEEQFEAKPDIDSGLLERVSEKIRRFFSVNTQLKNLKKEADPLNADIKDSLRAISGNYLIVEDIEAKLTFQERTSLNVEKLLVKLKKMKRKDLIKKIEIPDQEKIETLIYNQELDASLLEDCIESKTVEVLNVGKVKKKKADEENG